MSDIISTFTKIGLIIDIGQGFWRFGYFCDISSVQSIVQRAAKFPHAVWQIEEIQGYSSLADADD